MALNTLQWKASSNYQNIKTALFSSDTLASGNSVTHFVVSASLSFAGANSSDLNMATREGRQLFKVSYDNGDSQAK